MPETGVSTGVGPTPRGLKGQVAHGPDKDWGKVGKTVPVQLTAPVETVQWLRSNGYVLSRVFQEAASRLMGGGELDRLEKQIEFHKEQVTILEVARSTLTQRREEQENVESSERARLEAIQRLADLFYEQGRDDPSKFHRVSNVNWLAGRARSSKILRGSRPEDLLELILASRALP
jgi:hypothetical protein